MHCCDQTYDLGCIGPCDEVNTTVTAAQTGTYQVVYQTATSVARYDFDFTIGDTIVFENVFNEDSVSTFSVLAPDLTYINKDGIECFTITSR